MNIGNNLIAGAAGGAVLASGHGICIATVGAIIGAALLGLLAWRARATSH